MKNRIAYFIISLMLVLWTGCKEEIRNDHIDAGAPAPAQVSDVTVRDTHGGAVLKYKLPADKNLLYVKAVYEIQPGVFREAKSSYFKDSLVLEGYGDTKTHDVQIISVGKNKKESEPLIKQVNPLMPPVLMATKNIRESFGGVAIDIENPTRANLAIVLLADLDNIGYWNELITYWSSMDKGTFVYRGLDSISYGFAVYFRDRWGNLSDTVSAVVKPLFSEYIPKGKWTQVYMDGDLPPVAPYMPLSRIWDEVYNNDGFHGVENLPLPHTLTWDLGQAVRLNRLILFPRYNADDRWKRGHPKLFEIYGRLDAPNTSDGSMDDWIPLGQFESLKPSGPGPTITQEDIDFAIAGIEFDFVKSDFAPEPYTPIRYVRFRAVTTYANATISTVSITEIDLWGTIIK